MRLVIDLETNGLKNPDKIHCIVARDIDTDEVYAFTTTDEIHGEFPRFFRRRCSNFIGHNCIDFDIPILGRLLGLSVDPSIVVDTLVYSRLLEFRLPGGHSLEAWGQRLGVEKSGINITDWSHLTEEMLNRCVYDTQINAKLFHHLEQKARVEYKDKFREALKVELQMAWICREMHDNGFGFDKAAATSLYEEISTKVQEIDNELETAFPPKVTQVQLKTKIKEIITPFNPGSPKQIVERLQGFWKPTEKTDSRKSWKVSETNLATLSPEAPRAAQRLVERLMLASRLRTLEQWFNAYNDKTSRIHPVFIGLGTWTHRMAHREPNLGNVAAPKSIKYRGEVLAKLATGYGGRMRELWGPQNEEEVWLVGTDAEGIQLRIFGHYINDEAFIQSLVSGKKEDGTDPHSLNATILECSRDSAKTFIYAFLLGAGDRKIGEILGVSKRGGAAAKKRFINAIPGLAKLKGEDIPRDAKRGYIVGFDGRLVGVHSEHEVMPAYLQTGEAVIMKHANVLWRREIDDYFRAAERTTFGCYAYRQVNFVHDEWQTEVRGSKEGASWVGGIQRSSIQRVGEQFRLKCPMAGNSKVGKNWLETH